MIRAKKNLGYYADLHEKGISGLSYNWYSLVGIVFNIYFTLDEDINEPYNY